MFYKEENIILQKNYEDLTFADDFIFCKLLTINKELCKELLELILNVKISRIEYVEDQKSVDMTYDGKGVRFDVYVEDDDTVYDIEMQTSITADIPKRIRYYQGMIDLNLITAGESYKKLKKTFIIFICLKSPFDGFNLPIYTFSEICEQDNRVHLNDDTVKIIINAAGDRSLVSQEMAQFLDYVSGNAAEGGFVKKLDMAVDVVKTKKELEVEYMTLRMKLQEEREEGREEGREERC